MISAKERKILSTISEAGEVEFELVDIYSKFQNYHFRKGGFFLATLSLVELFIEKDFAGNTFRVLWSLLLKIDYNNRIKAFRQQEIADSLKTSQANISRALKVLEKEKIIYKKDLEYYFNDKYIKYAGDKKNK